MPNYPISLIDFHGTEDDTIPYDVNSPDCVGEGPQGVFIKGHKTKQFENSHCNLNIQEPSSRSMGTTTIQRQLSLPGESTLVLFGFQ